MKKHFHSVLSPGLWSNCPNLLSVFHWILKLSNNVYLIYVWTEMSAHVCKICTCVRNSKTIESITSLIEHSRVFTQRNLTDRECYRLVGKTGYLLKLVEIKCWKIKVVRSARVDSNVSRVDRVCWFISSAGFIFSLGCLVREPSGQFGSLNATVARRQVLCEGGDIEESADGCTVRGARVRPPPLPPSLSLGPFLPSCPLFRGGKATKGRKGSARFAKARLLLVDILS